MDNNDMAASVIKMGQDIRDSDPLLKRGIERDWVCVIPPALVGMLEAQYERFYADSPIVPDTQAGRLRRLAGREVYVIDHAPQDKIEYMSKPMMHAKYLDWFKAEIELRLRLERIAAIEAKIAELRAQPVDWYDGVARAAFWRAMKAAYDELSALQGKSPEGR